MSVSPSQIILGTNGQFSILWFIYSEINEPFAQHSPALMSSYSTLSLVNCPLSFSKALPEHPRKQKKSGRTSSGIFVRSNKQYIIRFYWLCVRVIGSGTWCHMEVHLAAGTWAARLIWVSRHYSKC